MSTSRVFPSNGPGDGSDASINCFVIWTHCDDTERLVECDDDVPASDSGVGAGHVLVLITIFSGRVLPPPTAVEVMAASDD